MLERLRITYRETESVDVARCKVVDVVGVYRAYLLPIYIG